MARSPERWLAIDWLRGLVMVLMALDHVDHASNPNHAQGDGALFGNTGLISAPDYTVRWLTHLCAPTFVLLAGVSIALSAANARARGATDGQVDRHLVARGLVIIALELTIVSYIWRVVEGAPQSIVPVFPQVLYAIGGGIALMPLLRRLPAAWLIGGGIALLVACDLVRSATIDAAWNQSLVMALLFTAGGWWHDADTNRFPDVIVLYPLLPWLPSMLLGLVLGRRLVDGKLTPRLLACIGVAMLTAFLVLRGINGFGNMEYFRRSGAILEWLHCSKYPPSMTFLLLELGLALLLFALLMRLQPLLERLPKWNPLDVLGRVPLFYYLLHLPMIGLLIVTGVLPQRPDGSAGWSLLGMLVVALACWPPCLAYAWYKRRYRHAWTRYL